MNTSDRQLLADRLMQIQEKYNRMDWNSYRNEQKQKGRKEAEIIGVLKIVRTCGINDSETIIDRLITTFHISREEAENYLKMHSAWEESDQKVKY